MELAEFLLARIAEDEGVARAATDGRWEVLPYWFTSPLGNPYSASVPGVIPEEIDPDDAAHIARHDPARVLAECEAKRRIVELHAVVVANEWVNPPDGPAYQEPERT